MRGDVLLPATHCYDSTSGASTSGRYVLDWVWPCKVPIRWLCSAKYTSNRSFPGVADLSTTTMVYWQPT